MDVSENWTCSPAVYPAVGLPGLTDATPFALLHGEGRWVVLARDPLAVVDVADLTPLRFQRSGTVPPIRPDLVGFVGYGFGTGVAAPRNPGRPALTLPDSRFVLYGSVRIWDRAQAVLYEGVRVAPRTVEPRPSLLRPGRFRAHKIWDTDTPGRYRQEGRAHS